MLLIIQIPRGTRRVVFCFFFKAKDLFKIPENLLKNRLSFKREKVTGGRDVCRKGAYLNQLFNSRFVKFNVIRLKITRRKENNVAIAIGKLGIVQLFAHVQV